jgi:excisionase family DNA binding protein
LGFLRERRRKLTLDTAFIAMMRNVVREELARLSPRGSATAEEFISLQRAAQRAGVSEKTIRHWIKSGALKAAVAGRVYRIRPKDLDALLTRPRAAEDDRAIVERLLGHARPSRRRG